MTRIIRRRCLIILVITVVLGLLVVVEFKTFYLQSLFLSRFAQKLSFSIGRGQNSSLRFPKGGPYDKRLGYTRLPAFFQNLRAQGYRIEAQARLSPQLTDTIGLGLFPSYREKSQAGLTIFDSNSHYLFKIQYPGRVYAQPALSSSNKWVI